MKYKYIVKNQKGEKIEGTLSAESQREAEKKAMKKGLFVLSVKPVEPGGISFKFGRVSIKDKVFFVRHLRIMLSAGLSLSKALNSLGERVSNKKFKKVIFEMEEQIDSGKKFSEALLSHPEIFSPFFYNMVKSGEETGKTERVLKNIVTQMENKMAIQGKIKSAMIYPSVIVTAMIGMFILMMVMVVPQMGEVFEEMELDLPASTTMIMNLGDFLFNNVLLIPVFIVSIIIFSIIFLRSKSGKKVLSFLSLKIPVISSLSKKKNSAHIGRTLSYLLASGISINDSLEIVSDTLANFYVKKAIKDSCEEVKKGKKLSEYLKKNENLFSPLLIQMIEVGEDTGETSDTLLQGSKFLEEEVMRAAVNLTSVIEPVLMIFIGATIGFFAFSILRPMYTLIETM